MFKKCMSIFLIYISPLLYADNGAGNIGGVGNIGNTSPQNLKGLSSTQMLDVKYNVYNYNMKQEEFAKFLETNDFSKITNLSSSKNIVFISSLQKAGFDKLNQKLARQFLNKSSGSNRCIIADGLCAASSVATTDISKTGKPSMLSKMSISVKLFIENTKLSAKVISDNNVYNQANMPNLVSFKSEAVLKDIKNRNYVLISQVTKNGILYGQIILISFSNS
ncbi:MAG: hypothetical protein K0R14_1119 [Burkholderiales bacterium]|nr:hypothetical protein [Burkholderiales bacterium]